MRRSLICHYLIIVLGVTSQIVAQKADTTVDTDRWVSLDEILTTLRSSTTGKEELNQKLIASIRDRRVKFLLDAKMIKDLRDAGATEGLLETIDTFLTPREKPGVVDDASTIKWKKARLKELLSLEDKIRELYGKKESRVQLIEIGKEFLKKFGSDDDAQDMAGWLRHNLPRMERVLRHERGIW